MILTCKLANIGYTKLNQQRENNIMLNKCHLDQKTAEQLGESFYRVNNDSNGNPRYVIHWGVFGANDYNEALNLAKSIGYKAYRASEFGGGFVTSSYNLESEAEAIINARGV